MSERGSGVTTSQIQSLPHGGVFVWCNSQLDYPKRLAATLGRSDIQIVSPSWLEDGRWRGMRLKGLHIDRAANLNDNQWDGYAEAITRISHD